MVAFLPHDLARHPVLAAGGKRPGSLFAVTRPTGYGAVPHYRPVALANSGNMPQTSGWRGRRVDITGYYQIGLRPYDPVSGRWLTSDSFWNERDPNWYTFVGGEPIMGFDADGRLASTAVNFGVGAAQGLLQGFTRAFPRAIHMTRRIITDSFRDVTCLSRCPPG